MDNAGDVKYPKQLRNQNKKKRTKEPDTEEETTQKKSPKLDI